MTISMKYKRRLEKMIIIPILLIYNDTGEILHFFHYSVSVVDFLSLQILKRFILGNILLYKKN